MEVQSRTSTNKTIAILGATNSVGSAMAERLAKSHYRLLLMSDKAQELAALHKCITALRQQTSETISINCVKEASWEADVIIDATPAAQDKEVAEKIRDVAVGKTVISVSDWGADLSSGKQLQELLPYSSVIRMCNVTFTAGASNERVNALLACKDSGALVEAAQVLTSAGFTPVLSTIQYRNHA